MATPPNLQGPRDEPNAYNKRVWQTNNYNNNKQRKAAAWSCNICTFVNDVQYGKCLMCGEEKWGNQFPDPMRMSNPYLRHGGRINMPPPITQYNMHTNPTANTNTNTNSLPVSEVHALHRYNSIHRYPHPTYPMPATLPSIITLPSLKPLILPSEYNLLNSNSNNDIAAVQNDIADTTNNSIKKVSKKHSDLHPLIASQIDSSVPVFKQAVIGVGVAENENKSTNKEYNANNILGATDWLSISPKQLLQNFGKKVNDSDKDRLYYAMQKYIKEYPKGPFKGQIFWDKVTEFANTTRTASSWKTHWNDVVKDKNKGTHRWSQLVALKALLRKKTSANATNNQLSTLKTYTDKQRKKKEQNEIKKQLAADEIIKHKQKLNVLLDMAINEKKQKKLNNNNYNSLDTDTLDSDLAPSVKVKELKKDPPTAATIKNKEKSDLSKVNQKILTDLKDMIDDIEDDGLLDAAQLDALKKVLYLDSNHTERDTLIGEFTRLDSKYYRNDKIIQKLFKIHMFFEK